MIERSTRILPLTANWSFFGTKEKDLGITLLVPIASRCGIQAVRMGSATWLIFPPENQRLEVMWHGMSGGEQEMVFC
jgi:hypothetical protein